MQTETKSTQKLESAHIPPKPTPKPKPPELKLEVLDRIGRPTKLTDEIVKKLEDAFSIGSTILEACIHAGISKQTYYNWIEDKPELLDYFEQLREKPVLKARNNIAKLIQNGDPETSKWFLERKKKDEFSLRTELTGKNGEGIKIRVIDYDGQQRNTDTPQLRPGNEAIPAESAPKQSTIQVASYSSEGGENGPVDQQDQPSGT